MDLSLGSPLYMAPELAGEKEYDERVDVWSCGVITYILVTGSPPFFGNSKDEIYHNIQKQPLKFQNESLLSKDCIDFIKMCLQKNAKNRPTVDEMFDHPWIKNNVSAAHIDQKIQIDISKNLASFRKTTAFQSGVLSFIANLQTSADELKDLKNMFIKLDSSRDGYLQKEELEEGFADTFGIFRAEAIDYDELMQSMDTDGDGRIDYTEFITAAFNRQKLVNEKNLEIAFKIFDSDGNG